MCLNSHSLCLVLLVISEVKCYNEEQNPTYMAAPNLSGPNLNEKDLTETPPSNQTVAEGEEVEFECLPKNTELTGNWYKDGILLSEVESLQNRYEITENNILIIQNVSIYDHGGYECEVTSDDGSVQTAQVFLDVQYKAKVTFTPPEILLRYDESGSIDCHFKANPPITEVRWEKDGVRVNPNNLESVFLRRNGSLYIAKTDERHSGRYTCTPSNDLGTEGPSSEILVVVKRFPVFVVTPPHAYSVKVRGIVEMPCDAKHGDDGGKPVIVWSKQDGAPIPKDRSIIVDGKLIILDLQKGDEGIYRCSASNRMATISVETELLIEEPTIDLTVESLAVLADSVKVGWSTQAKGSLDVWYRAVGSTTWERRQVPSPGPSELVVSGLRADTEYEFMMMIVLENGDNFFSKSIRARTKAH